LHQSENNQSLSLQAKLQLHFDVKTWLPFQWEPKVRALPLISIGAPFERFLKLNRNKDHDWREAKISV
jgi:hypothetical protein